MAIAINKRTGKTVSVPEHYIGHSVLGKDLEPAGSVVKAAPKKEKKKSSSYTPASFKNMWDKQEDETTEEQPAPNDIKENEE